MEKVMVEFFRFLIAYFAKPQNAGMTFAALCLASFGWFNLKQSKEHFQERQAWRTELAKKDSSMRVEREMFISRIVDLRRDVLECKIVQERLENEVARLRLLVERNRLKR